MGNVANEGFLARSRTTVVNALLTIASFAAALPRRLLRFVWVCISGEWIINCVTRSNGGFAILLRAGQFAIQVLGLHLLVEYWLGTHGTGQVDASLRAALCEYLDKHFTFIAAAFGAAYAALYSRFSAQWEYLAGVYNAIKRAEIDIHLAGNASSASAESGRNARADLSQWKKAFIEDAVNLHLAYKPLFSTVVAAWIHDPEVAALFVNECGKSQWRNTIARRASRASQLARRDACG